MLRKIKISLAMVMTLISIGAIAESDTQETASTLENPNTVYTASSITWWWE